MGCCESREKEPLALPPPVDLGKLLDDDSPRLARKGSCEHVGEDDDEEADMTFSHSFNMRNEKLIDDVYDIDSDVLGAGAAGTVRKAKDKSTGAFRAIKTIDPKNLGREPKALEALKNEVQIQRNLDHPHVVKLYEEFADARFIYLVMEVCTGGELFDRIIDTAPKGFSEQQASHFMQQILQAVAYIHKQHVCHRDIKPENFIMQDKSPDALVKMIDFGIATKFQPDVPMTAQVGTLAYCAPEVFPLHGVKGYNQKVDVWSSGVVLYILLSGMPPFYGKPDGVLKKNIANRPHDFPEDHFGHTSKEARDLVDKMLKKTAVDRPEASELLHHPWIQSSTSRETIVMPKNIVTKFQSFAKAQKLKKLSLTLIATQLEQTEIDKLRQQFEALDTNQDGTLSKEELARGLKTLNLSDSDLERIMDIDSDGSGEIDWTEFIAAALDRKQYNKKEVLWSAFRRFDLDGDGFISKAELTKVMECQSGHHLSDKRLQDLMAEADEDGDGQISFEEFMHMMQR